MKKEIKLLQIEIQNDKQMFEDYGERVHFDNNIVSAIENLINKYKEQEKIIELMAKAIHDYEDWTDLVCNIMDCHNTPHCKAETKEQELNCIKKYFKKKARENI